MTAYFLDSSALVKRYAREIGACASVCNPLPVFIYLAVVLDAFSRRVIGWALDELLRINLIFATHPSRSLSYCRFCKILTNEPVCNSDKVKLVS